MREDMSSLDEARVRRYLLGRLAEDDAEALEAEYFAHPESLERIWGVENDLVDAYVAGELDASERSAFESHYLASPVHRERVEAARRLHSAARSATRPSPAPSSWTPWLALAAALLLALTAWWLRSPASTRPIAEARPTPSPAPTAEPPDTRPTPVATPADAPRPVVAAFALSPVLLRGSRETPVLRVPAGTDELALTLEGERPEGLPAATRLTFAVTTVEGARVTEGALHARSSGLGVARLAAGRVPPGDYILAVRSADGPLYRYYFRTAAR